MSAAKSVLFAMRYPDDIGVVWASMGRIYDAVAGRLAGRFDTLVAYPRLTGRPAFQPERLRPVEADFYSPAAAARVAEVCESEGVKAVVYFGGDPGEIPLESLRRCGVRTINYDQFSYPVDSAQSLPRRLAKVVTRRLLKRNLHDLYLAPAEHQRRFLVGFACLPPGRVQTVTNGVDPVRFSPGPPPDPAALGLPPADRYVVTVCQAREEKRVDLLIAAAGEYVRRYPADRVTFVHVGDGPALAGWAAAAAGLGDRFAFAGHRGDVAPFHRLATVYAHTADRESFGFAVAEAMATGVPVVAADAPGPAELLRGGVGGTVVRRREPAAFADAIRQYLADPAAARATGMAGRDRVLAEYTLDRQVDELTAAVLSTAK